MHLFRQLAHVFLPAAIGAEKSGSFTSIDNRIQCFTAAVKPAGDARTDADILTTLQSMVVPGAANEPYSLEALQQEPTALPGL